MRILVTGGAGFIGSHLCDRLLSDGHEVFCLDSFFSGKRENIAHHLTNPKFHLIRQDVRKSLALAPLDQIYHLACPASPTQYQFDPVMTLETSVYGTQRMLDLARRTGAKMVFTSTSEAYGDPLEHPQKETYWGNVDPLGARACYDEGKRAAEALCKDYHEQYGVDVRIVRIFNTYGPRMMFHDGRVLSNFILQSLLGEDITIHGDGAQTRSFCYVDDLVEGLVRRMHGPAEYFPVNLGNPDERTIAQLAEDVKKETNTNSKITFTPLAEIPGRMGDPKQRCPDISRAKQLLQWAPTVSFADGLKRTVDDFRTRLEHPPRLLVFLNPKAPEQVRETVDTLIKRMPEWHFDIASSTAQALTLHRKYQYQISWVVTAGKASISAALFSLLTGGCVPALMTTFQDQVTEQKMNRGTLLSPLYKLAFLSAHRWQVIGEMTEQQRAWLEEERHVHTVKPGNVPKLAKQTHELLQELEIVSTRLAT